MTTNFYDRYFLDRFKENKSYNNSVLKKNYTLDYNDYDKLKIAEQYNKLYNEVYKKNQENVELHENKKIYNLSLNTLFNNAGKVYISMLNELSIYFSDKNNNKNINKLGLIFTKDENLLYIGLLILIISFCLWLIDITK
jgi:hypothetical protein